MNNDEQGRADFYILPDHRIEKREHFLCRLVEKALTAGSTLHILCSDQHQLEQLDRLLWEFRADAFIPHDSHPDNPSKAPVTLSTQLGSHPYDVLINMALELPALPPPNCRILEIVIQDEQVLSATRNNYSLYRDAQRPVSTHKLKQS